MNWTSYLRTAKAVMVDVLGAQDLDALRIGMEMLPYSLHEIGKDHPDAWIWLNRAYKPLGLRGGEWFNYAEFEHLHVGRNDRRIADLIPKCNAVDHADHLFLFADHTDPRRSLSLANRYFDLLLLVDCGGKP